MIDSCLSVCLSVKPFKKNKPQLREPPLVLHQQDWVERTTALQVEWSNLALLHPHGWRRLQRRNARFMGCAINKPLASKEADAVNICPGTVALGRAPGVFILAPLSPPLSIFWSRVPLPDRLSLALGRCSGMCLRRCAFANTAVRREMRFHYYHYLSEEEGHISLRVNARPLPPPPLLAPAQPCLSISEVDRWSWAL